MNDEKPSPKKLNAIIRAYLDNTVYTDPDAPIVKVEEYDPCYHNFVLYQGLIQTYEFCLYCNKKRDIVKEVSDCPYWTHDDDGSY
jgi:hypothetical protein